MPATIRVVEGRTVIQAGENTAVANAAASRAESAANTAASNAQAAVAALALDEVTAAAADAGIATVIETEQRDGAKLENPAALRDLFVGLSVFNEGEDGVLAIGSYGDSVSADVAMMFCDTLAREHIGFFGSSSFGVPELTNPLAKPTGTEPDARWPISGPPSYTLAGGATYYKLADADTTPPTYLPNSDQHWVIPAGGSVTFETGFAGAGVRRIVAYLIKEPGAGAATVELLNAADNSVIGTSVLGSMANATIAGDKSDFTNLDTSLGYKVRVSASGGTVRCAGIAALPRRCVLHVAWRFGGSTLNQQAASSDALFHYINTDLGVSSMFVETRGETEGDGIVGGVDGMEEMADRLDTLTTTSKIIVGNRATDNATADADERERYRALARARGYAFIDGGAIVGSHTEIARLNWNKRSGATDNVHLNLITAAWLADWLIARLPLGFIRHLWNTRRVVADRLTTDSLGIRPNHHPRDISQRVSVIEPYGLNVALAKLENVGKITLKNPYIAGTAVIEMFGSELGVTGNLRVDGGINTTAFYLVNGAKVVGAQQSAIPDHASDATVNAILAAMRAHGLIAT